MLITKSNPTFLLAVILACSFSQTTYSNSNIKPNGLQLRMIHIDSPDSPMYQPEFTNLQRINRLLAISDYRMHYLANKTSQRRNSRYLKPDVASLVIGRQNLLYYVKIGIGQFDDVHQPYHNNYLAFDTGSEVIWTQCENCRNCFHQRLPLFPNSKSRTYHPFNHNECPADSWSEDHCEAMVMYDDGTQMTGIWAHETFTFTSTSSSEFINGLNFVCATNIHNFLSVDVDWNVITGVLGMNKGGNSLISQLGSKVEYKFSYCLQDFPGYFVHYPPMELSFGDQISKPAIMYATPILSKEYYYVSLLDISVENKKLNIPSNLFALKPNRAGGTLFDTGTAFTYMVSAAFDILENAIIDYVTQHNLYLKKSNIKPSNLEACWEPLFNFPEVRLPQVTFHLDQNANLVVEPDNMFLLIPLIQGVPFPGLYCLTVQRAHKDIDINIIGSYKFRHIITN